MTIETRSSALDPFLTMRAQSTLLMEPPAPQLLIDGDNLTVTNALDRTDDPAVLITGSNNAFVNQTGATLTGTGTNARPLDEEAAVEITGAGNSVENQAGATIAGTVGISSSAANTSIVNDGDILVADPGVQFFEDSIGVLIGDDSSVVNGGLVRADALGFARAIQTGDGAVVQNDGTVETSAGFAFGISVGADSTIVNYGLVQTSAISIGTGLSAVGPGSSVQNHGIVRTSLDEDRGSAFGIGTREATVWNGGTIEATAATGGNASGIEASNGSVENHGTITASATHISEFRQGSSIGMFLNSATGSNSGTVTASTMGGQSGGGLAIGVVSLGGGSVGDIRAFANDGDILATASQAFGIVTTDFADLTNTGAITATGSIDPPLETGRSVGLELQNDAAVVNTEFGSIHALANFQVTGIFALDRAYIQNGGLVEATGGFASATGVGVGADSTVVSTGTVLAQAEFGVNGISAGDRATIRNDGVVEALGSGAFGVQAGSDSTIANAGMVNAQGDFAFTLSAGERSSIQNDGIVEVSAGNAFAIIAGPESTIVNMGLVEVATTSFGIGIGADAASTIQNSGTVQVEGVGPEVFEVYGVFGLGEDLIANTGTIAVSAASGSSTGALVGGGSRLTNTGDITAIGLSAKGVSAQANVSVVNDGTISAQSTPAGQPSVGISFDSFNSFAAAQNSVVNNGTIAADIAIADNTAEPDPNFDTLTVENTGLIAGALALGNGVDIVFNTGTIDGDVDLGSGDDVFDGRGGVVSGIVDGGAGDDIIHGGAGNEILIGGDGTDIIFGSAGADAIDGGAGLDTLDYSASAAGVQVNLGDATRSTSAPVRAGAGTAFGGDAEGDTFQGIERVIGSAFDDFVYGSPEGSIVDLGDGNDVFDNRSAESGNDTVDLGAGNDVARAGAGDDLVRGGAGNDRLSGEAGDDVLLGQDGNDRLRGGLGDDNLDGGAGDDLLAGGGGNDLFTFGLDGGNDRIFDFEAGANSDDAVDLTAFDTILSFDDVLGIASQIGGGDDDDDDDDGRVATVLTFDAETTLTFEGVRLAELNESDFFLV